MTDCQLSEERLQSYHDAELAPAEAEAVAAHAATCVRCHARLAAWRALGDALRAGAEHAAASTPAEPRVWESIAARLDDIDEDVARASTAAALDLDAARRERARERQRRFRRLRAAAIALAAGLGGLLFWRGDDPHVDVVRSLDTYGHTVLVLPEQGDATIIWMLDDAGDEAIDREGSDVAP